MVPRLLVFDLDGTLIDSRTDLANSINAMLSQLGKPALSQAVIAGYIGDGASVLVRRALGIADGERHDGAYLNDALAIFLDYYRVHKLDFTTVYDGVFEALEELWMAYPGVRMAVLTNKPVRPSRQICAHFGLDRFFFQNYGGDSFSTKKPDPAGLLALIAEASDAEGRAMTASETVMIGDSDVDILTARRCGARSIGCMFGLAPDSLAAAGPDALADSPKGWAEALRVLSNGAVAQQS